MTPIDDTNSLFRAEITAKSNSTGRWLYSWRERTQLYSTGSDTAPDSYRRGTATINPAVEINNHQVDVGTFVWLRQRGYVAGQVWYEFQYEPSSSSPATTWFQGFPNSIALTSDNTWFQSNYQLSIPSAGTYLLFATVTAAGTVSTLGSQGTGRIEADWYDVMNSVSRCDPSIVVFPQVVNRYTVGSTFMQIIRTCAAGDIFCVRGRRRKNTDGTVWSVAFFYDLIDFNQHQYGYAKVG